MPPPGRRKAAFLLLLNLGVAAALVRAPTPRRRAHCTRAADDEHDDHSADDDADDDDDDDEGVIGLEALPEALQSQIIEAITRSRVDKNGSRKATAVIGSGEDGESALFVFGGDVEGGDPLDDDESPFVQMGGPPGARDKFRKKKKEEAKKRSDALERIARFDLRPREVREHLDRYVVRQDDAKKVLSVAICDHYNVVRRCLADPAERAREYSKPNILVLGPSGSGKTYIMRTLARLLGVPFVKADATKFTETGIVGEDAEDLVRQLVEQADGDVELAQYGVIYVDEIDKLCRGEAGGAVTTSGQPTGAGNRGVQNTFLKVMEETDISVSKQSGMIPEIFMGGSSKQPQRISTKHILFIFSGAFTGLDRRLREKHSPKSMGFGLEKEANVVEEEAPASFLKKATSADFVDAGLETEFIGRIPVRVAVDPLGAKDLELILLQSEGSVLRQYERDFSGYGVDLDVSGEAVAEVAKLAAEEKTGARGLVTVLERTFRDFKYELPCAGLTTLKCDAATVRDPRAALDAALREADAGSREAVRRLDARRFEADFAFKHQPLTIELDAACEDFLAGEARLSTESSFRGVARARLQGMADGLKRIRELTDESHFVIPLEMVLEKDKTLAEWIAAAEAAGKPDDADDADDEDDEDDGADAVAAELREFVEKIKRPGASVDSVEVIEPVLVPGDDSEGGVES